VITLSDTDSRVIPNVRNVLIFYKKKLRVFSRILSFERRILTYSSLFYFLFARYLVRHFNVLQFRDLQFRWSVIFMPPFSVNPQL